MDFKIVDYEDREVLVGGRVQLWDYNENHPEWGQDSKYQGTVTEISEWEGDVDGEGRSIGIPPYVYVKWDDGSKADFRTGEWEYETFAGFDREPVLGKVEELNVIPEPMSERAFPRPCADCEASVGQECMEGCPNLD